MLDYNNQHYPDVFLKNSLDGMRVYRYKTGARF